MVIPFSLTAMNAILICYLNYAAEKKKSRILKFIRVVKGNVKVQKRIYYN